MPKTLKGKMYLTYLADFSRSPHNEIITRGYINTLAYQQRSQGTSQFIKLKYSPDCIFVTGSPK